MWGKKRKSHLRNKGKQMSQGQWWYRPVIQALVRQGKIIGSSRPDKTQQDLVSKDNQTSLTDGSGRNTSPLLRGPWFHASLQLTTICNFSPSAGPYGYWTYTSCKNKHADQISTYINHLKNKTDNQTKDQDGASTGKGACQYPQTMNKCSKKKKKRASMWWSPLRTKEIFFLNLFKAHRFS